MRHSRTLLPRADSRRNEGTLLHIPRGARSLVGMEPRATFDCEALYNALDEQRTARGLGWYELADLLWEQSAVLNAKREGDHRLCGGAVQRLRVRDSTSCQYALFMLRWLAMAPEEFLMGSTVDVGDVSLPEAGADQRLRWDLRAARCA